MIRKALFGVVTAVSAVALTLASTATASAANPAFKTIEGCNEAGIAQTTAAGGPGSLKYTCEKTTHVSGGVAGCENYAYGCLGEYYVLKTWTP